MVLGILAALLAASYPSWAEEAPQTAEAEKPPVQWGNSTELSMVVTNGNSNVETFGLKNTLDRKSQAGRARFRIDVLRSDTSDEPFLLAKPGVTFLPGEQPTAFDTVEVRPGTEPDVQKYFAEGRYEGNLPKKATWNAGASWDSDENAGIVSRGIVFGGLGHVWCDRDDLQFRSSYSLSYTDRIEEVEDPEKEGRFLGVRLATDFMEKWGSTKYDNDFTFNISMEDFSDFNADLVQGISVSMSKHLSLKASLQLTYANEPALESVDVVVRAILIDPDGIPGSGDEFFQTVESGGSEFVFGEGELRKEKLDTIFRTSLQITF